MAPAIARFHAAPDVSRRERKGIGKAQEDTRQRRCRPGLSGAAQLPPRDFGQAEQRGELCVREIAPALLGSEIAAQCAGCAVHRRKEYSEDTLCERRPAEHLTQLRQPLRTCSRKIRIT